MSNERPDDFFSILALIAFDQATEIGLKCGVASCCRIARFMVPWPGHDPAPRCQSHYEWTLCVADAMGLRSLIGLGTRPLDVKQRSPEPEDATVLFFAAMELS